MTLEQLQGFPAEAEEQNNGAIEEPVESESVASEDGGEDEGYQSSSSQGAPSERDEESFTLLVDGREERYTAEELGELIAHAKAVAEHYEALEKERRALEQKRALYEQYEGLANFIARNKLLANVVSWALQGYSERAIIEALQEYWGSGTTEESDTMETREQSDVKSDIEQLKAELQQQKIVDHNRQVFLQVMGELGYRNGLGDEEVKRLEQAILELYPDIRQNLRAFTLEQVRRIFHAAGLTGTKSAPASKPGVQVQRKSPPKATPAIPSARPARQLSLIHI
mgnify:CR=1 FL=1